MNDIAVSVVIPTRNRAALLRRALDALCAQSSDAAFEIVVVDDGSTDETPRVLNALAPPKHVRLRWVRQSHAGPAVARNRGVREATGDVIAFTDDDCVVAENWIGAIREAFAGREAAGFGGSLRSMPSSTLVGRFQAWADSLQAPPANGSGVAWLNTANAAFSRASLLAVGGFDEAFVRPGGEEVDLCRRLRDTGFVLDIASGMVVHYSHRESLGAMLGTYFRYGRGKRIGARRERRQGGSPFSETPPPRKSFWRRIGARWSRQSSRPVSATRRVSYLALDIARDTAYHLGSFYERLSERLKPRMNENGQPAADASGRPAVRSVGTWSLAGPELVDLDQRAIYERARSLAVDGSPPPVWPDYARTTRRTRTRRGLLWLGQTCNLRCHFCYFLDRIENPHHPEHAFMTLEKAKAICSTLVDVYGNNAIDIQGGEPTLFPGIFDLVRHCRDIGLHATLITNAQVLANRETVQAFRDAGIRDFLVSVQGLGIAYDTIVGRPGAHERQMHGLASLRAAGIPFRFNVVMSRLAMPQLPWIARLAADSGARVVNFLAFNPFDDQRSGKRSTDNVPRYSELREPLTEALDVLAENGIEANVRYLPLCMVEERHLPSMYNFQQLSYDHHENDFASWRWTFEQPQRTRGDALGRPPMLGPKLGIDRVRAALRVRVFRGALRGWPPSSRIGPIADDLLVRIENGLYEVGRRMPFADEEAIYRRDARVRAHRDLGYGHVEACTRCDLRAICDGFHSDYRNLFGGAEASAVRRGQRVDDPLRFIREQEKIVQPEDRSWALPPGRPS